MILYKQTKTDFYGKLLYLFLFATLTSFISENKTVCKINLEDSKETRLGKSNYYLRLPSDYKLTEARGKEGQLGYNIIPKNKSLEQLGFIEIKKGNPIVNTPINWGQEIDKLKSTFLKQETIWTLYKTETNYFIAETPKQKISARVSSDKRDDIQNLIEIISTLEEK